MIDPGLCLKDKLKTNLNEVVHKYKDDFFFSELKEAYKKGIELTNTELYIPSKAEGKFNHVELPIRKMMVRGVIQGFLNSYRNGRDLIPQLVNMAYREQIWDTSLVTRNKISKYIENLDEIKDKRYISKKLYDMSTNSGIDL